MSDPSVVPPLTRYRIVSGALAEEDPVTTEGVDHPYANQRSIVYLAADVDARLADLRRRVQTLHADWHVASRLTTDSGERAALDMCADAIDAIRQALR